MPHNLIKEKKLNKLNTLSLEGSFHLAYNGKHAFSHINNQTKIIRGPVRKNRTLPTDNLLKNMFGTKLHRQCVAFPMDTNLTPFVADLFLVCYERNFMLSLSGNNQTHVIEAFNSTSRYLDIDNPYFVRTVNQTYPTENQLNKANSFDTEAPCLDLNLSITNDIVSF